MLSMEGEMIRKVEGTQLTNDDMDEYALKLLEMLDHKVMLIGKLQSKLALYHKHRFSLMGAGSARDTTKQTQREIT